MKLTMTAISFFSYTECNTTQNEILEGHAELESNQFRRTEKPNKTNILKKGQSDSDFFFFPTLKFFVYLIHGLQQFQHQS